MSTVRGLEALQSKGFVEIEFKKNEKGESVGFIKEILLSDGKINDFSSRFFAKFDAKQNRLITDWTVIGNLSRANVHYFILQTRGQNLELKIDKFDIFSSDDTVFLESFKEKQSTTQETPEVLSADVKPISNKEDFQEGYVEIEFCRDNSSNKTIALMRPISLNDSKFNRTSKDLAKLDLNKNKLVADAIVLGKIDRADAIEYILETADGKKSIKIYDFDVLETSPISEKESTQNVEESKELFIQKSIEFYNSLSHQNFKEIELPVELTTIESLLSYCLKNFNGFEVSEEHSQYMSKKFFLEMLPFLKENGVEIIFMELFSAEQQEALNDFFVTKKLSPELEKYILERDYSRGLHVPYTYLDVVKAVSQAGIQIVGLGSKDTSKGNPFRFLTFNYHAFKIMSLHQGKKSISWTGIRHNNSVPCDLPGMKQPMIPGISKLTGRPNIMVQQRLDEDYEPLPKGVTIPALHCAGTLTLKADAAINL